VVDPELQLATWQISPPLQTQTLLLHVVPVGHAALHAIDPPQPSPKVPPQY
jgi:hypothetical protein